MNITQARQILGVDASADKDAIKKAYRSLAMKHHPDREDGNEAKFKEVKEAFEFLENTDNGKNSTGQRPDGMHPGGFGGFGGFDRSIFDEFVRNFAHNQQSRHWQQEAGPQFNQPPIADATIEISLDDAFKGSHKQVYIPGRGHFSIDIPAGVGENEPIKQIDAGDRLYRIFVKIKTDLKIDWGINDPHKRGDVTKDIYVPVLKMITGSWWEVDTIDGGKVSVRVPAGMEANKLLKVKDRGYWKNSERCVERGNLYLRVIPFIQKLEDMPVAEVSEFLKTYEEIIKPKEA